MGAATSTSTALMFSASYFYKDPGHTSVRLLAPTCMEMPISSRLTLSDKKENALIGSDVSGKACTST